MKLTIDGRTAIPRPGQSLLDIIKELGLYSESLSSAPLAAKIAGEVFNLNYIPLRVKDVQNETEAMRTAMSASEGNIRLLRYGDPTGREVYTRTAQFVLFLALHRLYPEAHAKMSCTVGSGLFIRVKNAPAFSADALEEEVRRIVKEDLPLCRRRITTQEAISYFTAKGQDDKARLFAYRETPTLDVYSHGDFAEYFYGETAPSTGFLRVWDIMPAEKGFLFIFPNAKDPDRVAAYRDMPNFLEVYTEGKEWCELMECSTVADLNELVDSGRIRELIRVNEALHEKRFSQVADMICQRGSRAVMLAGPSSSGKTTSANRLATQLRGHGKKPILMSLDDYYIDRDKILPDENGKVDLEHINTIDTALFSEHLSRLLQGEEVELPVFDFKIGKRVWKDHRLQLTENSVIIVEGLHALNPMLFPKGVAREEIFKVYVSPLMPLNLDDHNRIQTSFLRLLRRTVRDYETRNAPVQQTLSMWESVRRGEEKWIFPFQEQADVIFNSSTLYEPVILKRHIYPLLLAVSPAEECYDEVRAMVRILNFIHEADVDDEIPPTSLVREFIGGNTFYR